MPKLFFALLFLLFALSQAAYFVSNDDKDEKNKYRFQVTYDETDEWIIMTQVIGSHVVFATNQKDFISLAAVILPRGKTEYLLGTLSAGILNKKIKWDAIMYKERPVNDWLKSAIRMNILDTQRTRYQKKRRLQYQQERRLQRITT